MLWAVDQQVMALGRYFHTPACSRWPLAQILTCTRLVCARAWNCKFMHGALVASITNTAPPECICIIGDNPVNDIQGAREKIPAVTLQQLQRRRRR